MCISNLANESEFLNEISNMENEEGRTLEGHEALSADLMDLESQLNAERALLKVSLNLLKRARDEGMPWHLRREIDDALAAGKDYL